MGGGELCIRLAEGGPEFYATRPMQAGNSPL